MTKIKLNKRFKIEKVSDDEYHIIDRDMENITPNRLVAKCSYINSSIVCDALNIQYNLTPADRKKYSVVTPMHKKKKAKLKNANTKKGTGRAR